MKFEAEELALTVIRTVKPVLERVRRYDPDLARDMKRATTSINSNLGEGNRRVKGDRIHLWEIAAGSAGELKDQLAAVRAWGYVGGPMLDEADTVADRMCAMLFRLIKPR